ncbi:MAG TPA: hypothetical protein VJ952_08145, partial [Opitutales bacterium]|nr:hypothetical protein [Opitutales bacterium]
MAASKTLPQGCLQARIHTGENSRCRYDARQGVSLAQSKQPIPENALKFQVGGRYRTIRGGDPVSFGGSLGDTFADMGTDFATALEPLRGPLTITTGVGTTAAGILLTETVGFAWAGVPLTLLGRTQVGLGLSETADYFFGGNAFNTPTGSFE